MRRDLEEISGGRQDCAPAPREELFAMPDPETLSPALRNALQELTRIGGWWEGRPLLAPDLRSHRRLLGGLIGRGWVRIEDGERCYAVDEAYELYPYPLAPACEERP